MKKYLAIILLINLILCSCDNNFSDCYNIYNEANINFTNLDKYQLTGEWLVEVKENDTILTSKLTTVKTNYFKKNNDINKETIECIKVYNPISKNYITQCSNNYYLDETFYVDNVEGNKIKTYLPQEYLEQQMFLYHFDFTKEMIKSYTKEGNTIEFELDGNKLDNNLFNIFYFFYNSDMSSPLNHNTTFETVVLEATISGEKQLLHTSLICKGKIKTDDGNVEVNFTRKININPNIEPSISYPDNLNEYKTIDNFITR